MPRRWLQLAGLGLTLCALPARTAFAGPPGTAADEDAPEFWQQHFAVRLQVIHHDYEDVEIQRRRIKRNDLGLGFPQASVSAQNSAEHKSWRETSEVAALIFDPSGECGRGPVGVLVGVGARQADSDFGTERKDQDDEHPVVIAGVVLPIGPVTDRIRLDGEATVSRVVSEITSLDQVPGAAEALELRTLAWSGRITAAWRATDSGVGIDEETLGYEPYVGLLYHHLEIAEEFVANTGAAKSRLEFDVETESASEFRGIAGLRLLGSAGTFVDVEASFGSKVFGAGFALNLHF